MKFIITYLFCSYPYTFEENAVSHIARFFEDQSGGSNIEYGVVIAVVSLAAITIWGAMGSDLENGYMNLTNGLDDATG